MDRRFDPEAQRKWQELLERAGTPEWIREMQRYYRKTGKFRPEDLRRLLGDPNVSVEAGPNSSIASAMAQHVKQCTSPLN